MSYTVVKKEFVKEWVVKTAAVTNPYKRETWYASVTIVNDYNGSGKSIEKAYNDLTDKIYGSPHIMAKLCSIDSFIKIVKKQN